MRKFSFIIMDGGWPVNLVSPKISLLFFTICFHQQTTYHPHQGLLLIPPIPLGQGFVSEATTIVGTNRQDQSQSFH